MCILFYSRCKVRHFALLFNFFPSPAEAHNHTLSLFMDYVLTTLLFFVCVVRVSLNITQAGLSCYLV